MITQLAAQVDSADDLAAAVAALKKQAIEGILQAELAEHLGYEKHTAEGYNGKNSCNGTTSKTVLTDTGAVDVSGMTPFSDPTHLIVTH
ncbi:MAG: transposase [Myxococcota bacterium]